MKTLRIFWLAACLGLMLVAVVSCHNTPKNSDPAENNPILKSDAVLKALTEQIATTPTDAKLYIQRGDALRKLELDTLALRDYKHAVKLDSTNAAYYSMIGDYYFEHKDIDGSVQWLQKALQLDPKDKKSRLKIAKMFLYIGKHAEGLKQVDIVLRADVFNPEAYFLKGMLYKDMKDTAKAISSFQTALNVAPDFKDAVVQLAVIYSQRKDSIALRYLEKAAKIDSSDVFPIFAKGVYYQENHNDALAKEAYRKCILKDRHYADAYFNLGIIYMSEDSLEKAFRAYDMVTKTDPRNSTAYYDRGVCYEAMDSLKQAVTDYRHALLIDPTYESPKKALKRLHAKEPGDRNP